MHLVQSYRDTCALFRDNKLTVSNSQIRRAWEWTGKGLVTTAIVSRHTETDWTRPQDLMDCDWLLPGYDDSQPAELTDLTAEVSDDEGFTSEHLVVRAAITYPENKIELRYTIWIYPDVPGMRTQVSVKALDGYDPDAGNALLTSHHQLDFAPINFIGLQRHMFGYYNETQQRNDTCEDILKEETLTHHLKNREFHTWPSVLCLENPREGFAMVKESHKCPNQVGYDCGLFICDSEKGLSNHGWGLMPREIDATWRNAWASWCIVYTTGERGREAALKAFDAARYPLDETRDIYVQANTWGSCVDGPGSRRAAVESEVLKELDSCADLGIDVLQIDDGWQVVPANNSWQPDAENGWHPHPESYPNGWAPIKERAKQLGLKLGLWAAAQPISVDELKETFDGGSFATYKLDFAVLRRNEEIRALMQKVRDFISYTGHTVRVNWDVTEVSRRYGYFFAREFGCLYLANRKPVCPPSTTYRPHTMLRDLWQLSHYINLRKIQGSVQNIDRVNPQLSDASQHSHDYCLAITLMSTPLFFQQTALYDEAARSQLRPLLATYKQHRDAIFRGTVYPIGDKPDNYSWTGFQNQDATANSGYLLLFRELNNEDETAEVQLAFVAGKRITLTDLIAKDERTVTVGPDGHVPFRCDSAPGYLFVRYDLKAG